MMSTLLKLGLSGYDVKPRFGAFQCEYLLQNPLFFLGKNFGDTRHPYEKNEPTLDHSGGVHGKACWLIAYLLSKKTILCICSKRKLLEKLPIAITCRIQNPYVRG